MKGAYRECVDILAGLKVPQLDGLVVRPRRKQVSGTEGDAIHSARVSLREARDHTETDK